MSFGLDKEGRGEKVEILREIQATITGRLLHCASDHLGTAWAGLWIGDIEKVREWHAGFRALRDSAMSKDMVAESMMAMLERVSKAQAIRQCEFQSIKSLILLRDEQVLLTLNT